MSKYYHMPDPETASYKGEYPKIDLEATRKYMIDVLYKRPSNYILELEIKRKCGILTEEVVDYFAYDKKPENFIEKLKNNDFFEQSNSNNEERILIDEEDLVQPSIDQFVSVNNPNPNVENQYLGNSSPRNIPSVSIGEDFTQSQKSSSSDVSNVSSSSLVSVSKASEASADSTLIANSSSNSDMESKILSNDLKMTHACESLFKFCPKYLPNVGSREGQNELVYVCDCCNKTVKLRENILKHLRETNHLTASEYFLDSTGLNNTNSSTDLSIFSKVKYIKNRSTVRDPNRPKNESIAVFCPQCHFYFGTEVQACALHFRFVHRQNEEIYSFSMQKRCEEMTVDKTHSCFTCKNKFKKLTDLIKHLGETKHFPQAKPNEINLFVCPFDDCSFRSTNYYSFKVHIVCHPIFSKPNSELMAECRVSVKVYIYSIPTEFYHVAKYDEKDVEYNKTNEIDAINSLLEATKNHNGFFDINKKIKARKDQLFRLRGNNDPDAFR